MPRLFVLCAGTRTEWGNHPHSDVYVLVDEAEARKRAEAIIAQAREEGPGEYDTFVEVVELDETGFLARFEDRNPPDWAGTRILKQVEPGQ